MLIARKDEVVHSSDLRNRVMQASRNAGTQYRAHDGVLRAGSDTADLDVGNANVGDLHGVLPVPLADDRPNCPRDHKIPEPVQILRVSNEEKSIGSQVAESNVSAGDAA